MHHLQIQLGGALRSSGLRAILPDNGLRTEFVAFTSFHDSQTARREQLKSLDDFLERYFQVTWKIQFSSSATSVSAYQAVAKAYRRAQMTALEVRFNPRNQNRDLTVSNDICILALFALTTLQPFDDRQKPCADFFHFGPTPVFQQRQPGWIGFGFQRV